MKKLLILLLSLSGLACATGYNPTYYFNEVQVVNLSSGIISEVRIDVVGSSRPIYCAEVAKNALCADRFGKRRYPQQGIELSWTHTDGSRKSDSFSPPIPLFYTPVYPLRLMMEVNADGSVKPFYEQEDRGRDGSFRYLG